MQAKWIKLDLHVSNTDAPVAVASSSSHLALMTFENLQETPWMSADHHFPLMTSLSKHYKQGSIIGKKQYRTHI